MSPAYGCSRTEEILLIWTHPSPGVDCSLFSILTPTGQYVHPNPEMLELIHAPLIRTSSSKDFFQCSLSCTCLYWTSSGILLFSHSGFISSSWNSLLCSLVYINLNIVYHQQISAPCYYPISHIIKYEWWANNGGNYSWIFIWS